LDHPNVLKLLAFFHDNNKIYLALEYAAKGELFGILQSQPNGRFPEAKAARYRILDQLSISLKIYYLKN
jgi:serine/threonine protein kinase